MPLGEQIRDDMGSVHAKFQEFSMHRKGDINLSLFSFSEICRLAEPEFNRYDYKKVEVLDQGIPTKLD
jgi:hypothetical protein